MSTLSALKGGSKPLSARSGRSTSYGGSGSTGSPALEPRAANAQVNHSSKRKRSGQPLTVSWATGYSEKNGERIDAFKADVQADDEEDAVEAESGSATIADDASPVVLPHSEAEMAALYHEFATEIHLLGKELQCPVCLSLATVPAGPTCGHTFCHSCISSVASSAERGAPAGCPLCKKKFTKRDIRPDSALDSIITAFRRLAKGVSSSSAFAASGSASAGSGSSDGAQGLRLSLATPPATSRRVSISPSPCMFTQVPDVMDIMDGFMEDGEVGEEEACIGGGTWADRMDAISTEGEAWSRDGASTCLPLPASLTPPPSSSGRMDTQEGAAFLAGMHMGEEGGMDVEGEEGVRGDRQDAEPTPPGITESVPAPTPTRAPPLPLLRPHPHPPTRQACAVCALPAVVGAGRVVRVCGGCAVRVHASCYGEEEDFEEESRESSARSSRARGGALSRPASAWKCALCSAGRDPSLCATGCALCPCAPKEGLKPDALFLVLTGGTPEGGHLGSRQEALDAVTAYQGKGEGGWVQGGVSEKVRGRGGRGGRRSRSAFSWQEEEEGEEEEEEEEEGAYGPAGAGAGDVSDPPSDRPVPHPPSIVHLPPSYSAGVAMHPSLDGRWVHAPCAMWMPEVFKVSVQSVRGALTFTLQCVGDGTGQDRPGDCAAALAVLLPVLSAARVGSRSAPTQAMGRGRRGRGRGRGRGAAPPPPPVDEDALYPLYSQAMVREEEVEEGEEGDPSSLDQPPAGAVRDVTDTDLIAGQSLYVHPLPADRSPSRDEQLRFTAQVLSQMMLLSWLRPPAVAMDSPGCGGSFSHTLARGVLRSALDLLHQWEGTTCMVANACHLPVARLRPRKHATCRVCGLYGGRNGAILQCDVMHPPCMSGHHVMCAMRAGLCLRVASSPPHCTGSEVQGEGPSQRMTWSYCSVHSPVVESLTASRLEAVRAQKEEEGAAKAAVRAERESALAEARAVRPAALGNEQRERLRAVLTQASSPLQGPGPGVGAGMGFAPAHVLRAQRTPLRIPIVARHQADAALALYRTLLSRGGAASRAAADTGPGVGGGPGLPGPFGIIAGAHWEEVYATVSGCDLGRAEVSKGVAAALSVFGMAWLPCESVPGGRAFGRGSTGANRRGLIGAGGGEASGDTPAAVPPSHVLIPAAMSKLDEAALAALSAQADATPLWAPLGWGSHTPQVGGHVTTPSSTPTKSLSVPLARRRTHGYLANLASGALLLEPGWVDHCASNGCMPDEEAESHTRYAVVGDKSCTVRGVMLMGPSPSAGMALWDRLRRGNAVSRARAAMEGARGAGDPSPSPLLFQGITFLLHGEWECPPKNVSFGDAVELITLAGGRVVDIALGLVGVGATPSRERLMAAGGEGVSHEPMSVRYSGLACPHVGGGTPSDGEEWAALLLALARLHAGAFTGEGVGGAGASHQSLPCPPLVVLCDEPSFPLPPALEALMAIQAQGGGGVTPVLTPDWLLDCVSTYTRLAPPGQGQGGGAMAHEASRHWLHPAYATWMKARGRL